jgi:tRNA threonylcarbamoyladenosine biosynthesis protein TsaB
MYRHGDRRRFEYVVASTNRQEQQITCDKSIEHDIQMAGYRYAQAHTLIILSIDTSDTHGSVAVGKSGKLASSLLHSGGEDYSSWLIPAVHSVLGESGCELRQLDLLAVCTGPGSFTGLRVGLTTVKAWAEIYGTHIVGVPRLEALSRNGTRGFPYVLACYDAQRGQNFAALYWRKGNALQLKSAELVATPAEILQFVAQYAGNAPVEWVQLGRDTISTADGWPGREACGDVLTTSPPNLAATIALRAEEYAAKGQFTDVLQLDANYVRRSDAEIFWKGPAKRVPR